MKNLQLYKTNKKQRRTVYYKKPINIIQGVRPEITTRFQELQKGNFMKILEFSIFIGASTYKIF